MREHVAVAVIRHLRGGQFRRLGKGLATGEQRIEAMRIRDLREFALLVDQAHHVTAGGDTSRHPEIGGLWRTAMRETGRVVSPEIDLITHLLQRHLYPLVQRVPLFPVKGILEVHHIIFRVHVPELRSSLFGRKTKPFTSRHIPLVSVFCGIVIDFSFIRDFQPFVPARKDQAFAIGRCRSLVFRHMLTIGSVAPKFRAIRVLEDDDRRRFYLKVRRHLGISMFIVPAATREDEEAFTVHTVHPIERSV